MGRFAWLVLLISTSVCAPAGHVEAEPQRTIAICIEYFGEVAAPILPIVVSDTRDKNG